MSVPVGQSRAQPLHDRHRSSASCTSALRQPSVTSVPLIISCRMRARPRVESFSARVACQLGHITPDSDAETHLPTPVQRCTSSTKPGSARNSAERRTCGARRSASTAAGSTRTPGFSNPCGSKICLMAPNSAMASGEYIAASSSERARPSPCSPDSDPP